MITFRPPIKASYNAKKFLKYYNNIDNSGNCKFGKGVFSRAKQLAKREAFTLKSINDLVFLYRYHKNYRTRSKFKKFPYEDQSYMSWLARGGNEGILWAKKIKKLYGR